MWSGGDYPYPGRSVGLSEKTMDAARDPNGPAEVSRGRIRTAGQSEGPNISSEARTLGFVFMAAQQLQFKWDQSSSPKGEACRKEDPVCQVKAASERTEPEKNVVMEEVVRRENLIKALKRVCANKGSPGCSPDNRSEYFG
jgi:hypothetical protein